MGFLLFLVLWAAMAIFAAMLAQKKNRSTAAWVLLSLPFGIFAVLVLACLPPLQARDILAPSVAETMRKCPACAEFIKAEAIKCRYCGSEVEPIAPPVSINTAGMEY